MKKVHSIDSCASKSIESFLIKNENRPMFGTGYPYPKIKLGNSEISAYKRDCRRRKKYSDYVSLMHKCHQVSLTINKAIYFDKLKRVKDRIDSIKYLRMKHLEERRQHLREILFDEEQFLIEEMNNTFPTADTRFHETLSKVYEYKMQKELDRQEFAKEMYDRRYRRDNPDLSKKIVDYRLRQVVADRFHNVDLKNQMDEKDKAGERMMDEDYIRRGQEEIERENEKQKQRFNKNKKIALQNVDSMNMRKQKEVDEANEKRDDEVKMLQEYADDAKKDKEEQFAAKIEKIKAAKALKTVARDLSHMNKSKRDAPRNCFNELLKEAQQEDLVRAENEERLKKGEHSNNVLQYLNHEKDFRAQEKAREKEFDHYINQEAQKKMLAELKREQQQYKKWKTAELNNQDFILSEIARKAEERAKDKAEKLTWKTSIELPSEKLISTGPDYSFRDDILAQIEFEKHLKQLDLEEKLRCQEVMKKETENYENIYNSILMNSNVDNCEHPMRKKFREMFPGRL